MIVVTSHHESVVEIAGVTARPNVPVTVDERKWRQFKGTRQGKNWLNIGLLSVENQSAKKHTAETPAPKKKQVRPDETAEQAE